METHRLLDLLHGSEHLSHEWRDDLAQRIIAAGEAAFIRTLAGPKTAAAIIKAAAPSDLEGLIVDCTCPVTLAAVPSGRRAVRERLLDNKHTPAAKLDEIVADALKRGDSATVADAVEHQNLAASTLERIAAQADKLRGEHAIVALVAALPFDQLKATLSDPAVSRGATDAFVRVRPQELVAHLDELADMRCGRARDNYHPGKAALVAQAATISEELIDQLTDEELASAIGQRRNLRWRDGSGDLGDNVAGKLHSRLGPNVWDRLRLVRLHASGFDEMLPHCADFDVSSTLVELLCDAGRRLGRLDDIARTISPDRQTIREFLRNLTEEEQDAQRTNLLRRIVEQPETVSPHALAAVLGTLEDAITLAATYRPDDKVLAGAVGILIDSEPAWTERDIVADIATLHLDTSELLAEMLANIVRPLNSDVAELFGDIPHTIASGPLRHHVGTVAQRRLPADRWPKVIDLLTRWQGSVNQLIDVAATL